MICPRQKMPRLLYIAASLLQNRFENLLKIFRVHGCWILYHGFTWKICGKFLKMKKVVAAAFCSKWEQEWKICSKCCKSENYGQMCIKVCMGGQLNVTNLFQETPQSKNGFQRNQKLCCNFKMCAANVLQKIVFERSTSRNWFVTCNHPSMLTFMPIYP